jgi:antitoxin (DNA-binding transcriptional repressor) of toxin-antitoxin stability system
LLWVESDCIVFQQILIGDSLMNTTFSDLRKNTKNILAAIERHEPVTLTYRGCKKALIIPCRDRKARPSIKDCPAFGMWNDREDMENVQTYVRNLRKRRIG